MKMLEEIERMVEGQIESQEEGSLTVGTHEVTVEWYEGRSGGEIYIGIWKNGWVCDNLTEHLNKVMNERYDINALLEKGREQEEENARDWDYTERCICEANGWAY